jgi:peptidoglycan-associated lipoprotein
MKKNLWIVTAIGALLLSGCAQSAPDLGDIDTGTGIDPAMFTDANAISGDTINIDESTYGNESGMVTTGGFNSSSDGFKSIYFGFDHYTVSGKMNESMLVNTQIAKTASGTIKIEGNCDEFGTDEYNYALGLKRAKAVKDTLIGQGIEASKIVMVSFGESTPVCQSAEDSCYEQNRRVDLRLVR